jgi:hypothetical protein
MLINAKVFGELYRGYFGVSHKCRNAMQASIAADFSAKTAYSAGGRMLKDVEVCEKIEKFDNAHRQCLC